MSNLLLFPDLYEKREPEPSAQAPSSVPDWQARRDALDTRRSWIVEAPAGSGKTGLLIQRFLKLLAFGGVEHPAEVLAITFTRKADAEMRTRVLDQLAAAAGGRELPPDAGEFDLETRSLAQAVLARDRELRWGLLESPHQLNIRTIDSFCAELAGNMPLLSGAHGRRRPTDDPLSLYQLAAERTVRQLGGPDPTLDHSLRLLLRHRDAQVSDCIRLIAEMLEYREQWGEMIPMNSEDLLEEALDRDARPRLERTLERAVCRGLAKIADVIGPDLLHELASLAARLSIEPGYKDTISPLALCAGRGSPAARAEDLDHWLALLHLLLTADDKWRKRLHPRDLLFSIPEAERDSLQQLISRFRYEDQIRPGFREQLCALRCLPPARYPESQWKVVKALYHVLRHALAELQVLFSERNTSDFADVALTARALLDPHSPGFDPATSPGTSLKHLLVDEMQDTSAGQYDLIHSLSQFWDGGTQTVFLVGDPKQSIYGFRQARVERFLRTMAEGRLGDVPLGTLRLTANFRSQAELVNQFNHTFELILPSPEELPPASPETVDVPFVAAFPTRPTGRKAALHWHTTVRPQTGVPSLASTLQTGAGHPLIDSLEEPQAIRRVIEDFLTRWPLHPAGAGKPPRHPRIAVLGRSRIHLAPIISEFHTDRGNGPLPFRAVDVEALTERPEILDLLALTRALLHPADRIAWLAVLRSPVCGLALADLLALTGEGPAANPRATIAYLVSTRSCLLSAEGQRLLNRIWPVLAEAQASLGRTDLTTHVERTWRSLGADAALCPEQRTNARRFFKLLRVLQEGPDTLTLPLLERRLQKLYAEPVASPTVVELMTIHKAKGLEWDLVLVPALERGSGSNTHELLAWLELDQADHNEAGFILAPIQGKGEESTALSAWLSGLQRMREAAECKRLFYVACTRAREELHLFGVAEQKTDGTLALPNADSLLRAAWPAARAHFEQHLQNQQDPASPSPSGPGQLLTMAAPAGAPLALAASAEDPDPATPGATHLPLLERLPDTFDPIARLLQQKPSSLRYPPAAVLRNQVSFVRPEGSFASRAFGNTVHRFLQFMAGRLETGTNLPSLLQELSTWRPRIAATLRSEGLPNTLLSRESARALAALAATLTDPIGSWLLSPRPGARSERAIVSSAAQAVLRADRNFLAGPLPLSNEDNSCLWIVDFKTAELGGRSDTTFLAAQKEKYLPQMQAYAAAIGPEAVAPRKIILGLYFPLLTKLIYWPSEPE